MKLLKLQILALLLLGLGSLSLSGQEVILATGNTASGSGGSVSYSVGQVFYTINSGANGSIHPGVQQAYIISEETGIDRAGEINLIYSVYPNPTTDYLTLKMEEMDHTGTETRAQLFDLNGKLLQSFTLKNAETSIDMSNLPASCYYLRIIQSDKEIKSYKIIKN